MAVNTIVIDFSRYGTSERPDVANVTCSVHGNRLIRRPGVGTYVIDSTSAAADNVLCGDVMALANKLHAVLGVHLDPPHESLIPGVHTNAISKISEFITDLLQTYASMPDYMDKRTAINDLIYLFDDMAAQLAPCATSSPTILCDIAEYVIAKCTEHMKANMQYAVTHLDGIQDLAAAVQYALDNMPVWDSDDGMDDETD